MLYRVQPVSIRNDRIIEHQMIWLNFDFVREIHETELPLFGSTYISRVARFAGVDLASIGLFELCVTKPQSVIYLVETVQRLEQMCRGEK